jgi:hypothetical protein
MERPSALPRLIVLAVLATGLLAARPTGSTAARPRHSAPASAMHHYVIIFRQRPHPLTEADKARRQEQVSAWARAHNAAGHKLEPRILGPEVIRPATFAGAERGEGTGAWPVTALLFLEARDIAEAAEIAAKHPAKEYGASVEVRPWAPPAAVAAPPR